MGTRVRAITAGSVGGRRIRPGTEFVLPDGFKPGKWLAVIEADVPAKSKEQAKAEAKTAAKAKQDAEANAIAEANAKNRNIASPPLDNDLA